MYEAFYGIREKPFSILPDPDLIYWAKNHRLAYTMLEFGLMNKAGFTVITGEIGSGKTTLVRHLLRKLDPRITVGLISTTPREKELLACIMMSLNQPFDAPYLAMFQQLQRFLYDKYSQGQHVVLVVDEAQNLGLETLEELRMLSNINVDKHQFLQIILVGQPQLKDLLRAPQLLQFAQRVSSDYHLRPLNQTEVIEYIDYRLKAVGAGGRLFSDQACQTIAEASQGVPRTINILCDTALVYGFAAGLQNIGADLVHEVLEDKAKFGVLPLMVSSEAQGVEAVNRDPAEVCNMTEVNLLDKTNLPAEAKLAEEENSPDKAKLPQKASLSEKDE
jgi:general secretion pathway protein A